MKHGRLPWFAPDDLDPEQRALYDRIAGGPRAAGPQAFPLTDDAGRLNGPFNAMLVSPDIGGTLQEVGAAIRYRSALSHREREIAILEVARLRRSEFEWYAHERVGRASGLTAGELHALQHGDPAPSFDARETIVRRVAHDCLIDRRLADGVHAEAEGALGLRALADVIALVGYYDLLALSLAVWKTPLPAGTEPVFASAPKGE
jgi:4-carboxymuconolactone decarboxylase